MLSCSKVNQFVILPLLKVTICDIMHLPTTGPPVPTPAAESRGEHGGGNGHGCGILKEPFIKYAENVPQKRGTKEQERGERECRGVRAWPFCFPGT